MKRTPCVVLGLAIASAAGLSGCSEETKVKTTKTIDTPTGSQTVKQTTEIEKTGDMKTNP
jgi:hypothetical protein